MEDLFQIANSIFDQNESATDILVAIREGKHSKQVLTDLLYELYPNLSDQEAESLLSLLFAMYIFELADAAGTSQSESPMALDAYFLVCAIQKKDRGNKSLIRNSLRFLSLYYWIDFTLEDASRIIKNLKSLSNGG